MAPDFSPLAGQRVVTIALNVPGPMAAERLRALGADVIKAEPPDGDPLRAFSPHWYADLAAGMTIVTIDLKTAAGQAQMLERLGAADLLLTSQRPSALRRLGLAWPELHARFPRLCQVAIVGHGAPHHDVAGHDLTYLAANGLLQPPALLRTLFADVAGAEQAALMALAALIERGRTAAGCYVEVALADAARRLAAPLRAGLTRPGALLGGGFPGYNLYQTKDGWVAVAALEPHFYQRLCQQLDVAAPSYEELARRFRAEPNAHWRELAQIHDLPIAPVVDTPAP